MLPVIAIVGRPNVGKSTLFNYLTKSRDALVVDLPGVTRDRQYGEAEIEGKPVLLIDTGGIVDSDDPDMAALTEGQVEQAIREANCVLFLVDAKAGLLPADEIIAANLRKKHSNIKLVVNKADNAEVGETNGDFYQLGFAEPYAVSLKRKRGLKSLLHDMAEQLPQDVEPAEQASGIKIAVIGRPNVGKSTLINRMLGEDRVIVCDRPGTTRDSIYIPFKRDDVDYTLIDTAGIRRRSKIHDHVEKFSIIQSMQAVHVADAVIFVIDAQQGLSEQDLRLLNLIVEAGSPLVIAINKWDGMEDYDKQQIKDGIDRRMVFVEFARRYFISALHGTGVGKLYHAIHESIDSIEQELSTSQLTKVLEQAVSRHEPPLIKGRRVRLRYAHLGDRHPLTIVIHGKQTKSLTESYQRYLANCFRKAFNFIGVPVQIKLKTDENPYS